MERTYNPFATTRKLWMRGPGLFKQTGKNNALFAYDDGRESKNNDINAYYNGDDDDNDISGLSFTGKTNHSQSSISFNSQEDLKDSLEPLFPPKIKALNISPSNLFKFPPSPKLRSRSGSLSRRHSMSQSRNNSYKSPLSKLIGMLSPKRRKSRNH